MLLTIVSVSTSQVNYILKGDTVVGYTPEENRQLAVLLKEGDEAEELLFNAGQTVEALTEQNKQYKLSIGLHELTEDKLTENTRILNDNITTLTNRNITLNNSVTMWRNNTIIGVVTSVLLSIIVILK